MARLVKFNGKVVNLDGLEVGHHGSAKNTYVLVPPTSDQMGIGVWEFLDRWSIWDLKELCKERIPGKGEATCMFAARVLENLRLRGIPSTYVGVVDQDGQIVTTNELKQPSNLMVVNLVQVIEPGESQDADGKTVYNYSMFRDEAIANFLIVLEIIFRLMLPQGSSKLRKIHELRDAGDLEGALALAQKLGLDHIPEAGERLSQPYLGDVTTKLEFTDRDLTWNIAREIAGLTIDEQRSILDLLAQACVFMKEFLASVGIDLADGKVEVVRDQLKQFRLGDVPCSMDECRFYYKGAQVSKEIIRLYYEFTQPDFYAEVKAAKATGRADWKTLLHGHLEPMDPEFKQIISDLYNAFTNHCYGGRFFRTLSLDEAVANYSAYFQKRGWIVK